MGADPRHAACASPTMAAMAAVGDDVAGGGEGEAHPAPLAAFLGGAEAAATGGYKGTGRKATRVRAMCLGQVLHFQPGENRKEK